MSMFPYKSYDDLFSQILTSYRNASPNADTAVGSELYIRAAGLASCIWGMTRLVLWMLDQMFPTTADPETLERYGIEFGLDKREGESWQQFLDRLLAIYRNTSGGGTPTDVERWAMDVTVSNAGVEEKADSVKCYPALFGPGTSVLLVSKTIGTPSQALLDRIVEVVLEKGPVVPAEVYAFAPTTKPVALSISMVGGSRDSATSLIVEYFSSLRAHQPLFPVIIQSLCLQAGASVPPTVTPSAQVLAGPFERIILDGAITWL